MTIRGPQALPDIKIIVAGHPDIMATVTIINIETIEIAATIATTTTIKETKIHIWEVAVKIMTREVPTALLIVNNRDLLAKTMTKECNREEITTITVQVALTTATIQEGETTSAAEATSIMTQEIMGALKAQENTTLINMKEATQTRQKQVVDIPTSLIISSHVVEISVKTTVIKIKETTSAGLIICDSAVETGRRLKVHLILEVVLVMGLLPMTR